MNDNKRVQMSVGASIKGPAIFGIKEADTLLLWNIVTNISYLIFLTKKLNKSQS